MIACVWSQIILFTAYTYQPFKYLERDGAVKTIAMFDMTNRIKISDFNIKLNIMLEIQRYLR
jgi:hypothetical protein